MDSENADNGENTGHEYWLFETGVSKVIVFQNSCLARIQGVSIKI